MKNYIIYHLTPINDYKERFINTLSKIVETGLYDNIERFDIILNGNCELSDLSHLTKINLIQKELFPNENLTINYIKELSENTEGNVLYLHCKGVTHPNSEQVKNWVEYMEFFLIEQYKKCLDVLQTFDTTGVNLLSGDVFTHYSGNFWWSRFSHIKQNLQKIDNINDKMQAERWILGNGDPKNFFCLHSSLVNHYGDLYPRSEYEKADNN